MKGAVQDSAVRATLPVPSTLQNTISVFPGTSPLLPSGTSLSCHLREKADATLQPHRGHIQETRYRSSHHMACPSTLQGRRNRACQFVCRAALSWRLLKRSGHQASPFRLWSGKCWRTMINELSILSCRGAGFLDRGALSDRPPSG